MADMYDLIVVGAGPGGTSAAKVAAEKKLKVLLLERARTPGDKNMSGSYLFRPICEEIFPGFQNVEDLHKGQIRWGGLTLNYEVDNDERRYGLVVNTGADSMYDLMTVFRNETDNWFTEQAVKAGAELKTALATDVIWENKGTENARVKGVVTDVGNFEAPVVIDASGLHSLIAQRTGLAKWDKDKIMLGLKYIYKLDPDLIRERQQTYVDTDGVDVDPVSVPLSTGLTPEFWGAHAIGSPGRGIINVCIYQSLAELMRERVNPHQRMQWYINQRPVKRLVEGAELIKVNVHGLAAGDMVGYVPKSYLPGLMLVGDAGGFSMPVDNFGANAAMRLGQLAGELAAEMKEKKDYSEAMFAKYEETWRNSWIGEDDVHEFCHFWRRGGMKTLMSSLDDIFTTGISDKWKSVSYPSIILGAIPKLIPAIPAIMEFPYWLKHLGGVGLKKVGGLLGLYGVDIKK